MNYQELGRVDGFARHMRDALPHASFIGFTRTPMELADANTRAVLGDYISVYDIQRAVQGGATVPIYYQSRLARRGDARASIQPASGLAISRWITLQSAEPQGFT